MPINRGLLPSCQGNDSTSKAKTTSSIPYNSHKGRKKELDPESCPLTFIQAQGMSQKSLLIIHTWTTTTKIILKLKKFSMAA